MTQAQYFRGGIKITLGADKTLHRVHPRYWMITASTSGVDITLPDATTLLLGYPVFVIACEGTNAINIRDAGGTLLHALAVDTVCFLALLEQNDADGLWFCHVSPLNSIGGGGITAYPMTMNGLDTLNDVYEYQYDADTWSLTSNNGSNNTCVAPATALIEEDAHLSGNNGGATDSFERYTPVAFTALTDDPQRRDGGGMADSLGTATDIAYYFGGDKSFTGRNTSAYYDKSADTHTAQTNIPSTHHSGVLLRDIVGGTDFILLGGSLQSSVTPTSTTTTRQYDSVGNSWATLTVLGTAKMNMSKARDNNDDIVMYCGASNAADATIYDTVRLYDISGDSYTSLAAYSGGTASRMGGCEVPQNNFTYLCGGVSTGTNTPADNYEHNVGADTYSVKTDHTTGGTNLRGWQHGGFSAVGI